MEHINLPTILFLIWDIKRAIETQKSLQTGLQQFAGRKISDEFTKNFIGALTASAPVKLNMYQNALLNIVRSGLAGNGIYSSLIRLEKEIIEICEDDIEKHTQTLPLKLQIPLLGLVFPSLMVILLVPIMGMLSIE